MICEVCRRDLNAETPVEAITVRLEASPEMRRVYPELALPLVLSVCHVCWLRSMGVPHIGVHG